jgi:hypothetical protein
MEPSDLDYLRGRLGERIPDGGTEAETMFTNHQLSDLIDRADGDMETAITEGWKIKVAELASLVDTAEGTSKRSMSDLRVQAQAVLDDLVDNSTSRRRTRIHTLGRD